MNDSKQIRSGEELDSSSLISHIHLSLGTVIEDLNITQFVGGYSNLTYLLTINEHIFWVLRKPPKGANIKSGHDMSREYKMISSLYDSYGKVPKAILFCNDMSVIGSEFYIMEKVDGWILRSNIEEKDYPQPEVMTGIFDLFVDNFVTLHNIDYNDIGLGDIGNPVNYPTRQIDGWTKRYFNAKTDDIASIELLIKWLSSHIPHMSRSALIHNDYKYDNMILDSKSLQINAVLDWEMSTLGDPLMDLGSSLAYWVNPDDPAWLLNLKLSPTTIPGNPTREGFLHAYATKSGLDPGNGVFYFAYGMLKLAVIAQQIYYRYKKGLTNDERFSQLNQLVAACGTMGLRAIERKKIDSLF